MNKERAGAGALAALLAVTGPTAAELVTPDPIIERGEMLSQAVVGTDVEIDLSEYKTLKPGDEGPEVAVLKQRMYDLGYFKNRSSVNETFTASTADYVKKFEEKNGLPVDGIADPKMQALFFSDEAIRADGTMVLPEKTSIFEDIKSEVPVEVVNRTEVISVETEEEKEVNQRFSDFLNEIGDYKETKINNKLTRRDGHFRDLGFYAAQSDYVGEIQAILLDSIDGEVSQYLALGVKDKKGERKIVVVEVPIEKVLEARRFTVSFRSGNVSTISFFDTKEEIRELFKEKIGKSVLASFVYNDVNEIYSGEKISNYVKYLESNKLINLSFLAGLLFPDKKTLFSEDIDLLKKIKGVNPQMNTITNLSGLLEIIENNKVCPVTATLEYNINET